MRIDWLIVLSLTWINENTALVRVTQPQLYQNYQGNTRGQCGLAWGSNTVAEGFAHVFRFNGLALGKIGDGPSDLNYLKIATRGES